MNREVKFRAYLKAESKMCDVSLIRPERGAFLEGAEPSADQYYDNGKLVVHALPNGRFCNLGEFELLQFTGLKDKNGKEIWEGDILNKKTTFQNNMSDRRFQPDTEIQVGFEDGYFLDINTKTVLYERIMTLSSYPKKTWTDYEVIGNIYENPDLL